MRRTKIICTLGPSSDSYEIIEKMILEGMNIVRVNCSHGTHQEHKKKIDLVKEIREKHDLPVAILLDIKGPEIRTGIFKNESEIINKDQEFRFVIEDIEGDNNHCSISDKNLYKNVRAGVKILINDGAVEMEVTVVDRTDIVCRASNTGKIGSRKGIHVSGISLNLPPITEEDLEDMQFAIENDLDFIAASFVRKASDVGKVREALDTHGGKDIQIIAKIESQEGIDNIDEIIEIADAIMVARGDLGVDIPPEDVPPAQKKIIRKCIDAGKPVITATQMLESMVSSPRPTRAEASDVANAIFDGTSAVMLSGETAAGKYPVESLQMMSRIAKAAEENTDYERRFINRRRNTLPPSITNAISYATCATAHDLDAAAIVSITKSGHTARMVSKFKPACPIIGITHSPKMRRQLALSWGVYPYTIGKENSTDSLFSKGTEKALETGIIKRGDTIVLTAGVPTWISGATNIMKVAIAGEGQE